MAVLNKSKDTIPPGAVYIGRGSKWGNPFVMGKHGDRDSVCEQYAVYLQQKIKDNCFTQADLAELHGKDLVCYCAPARCHGHELEKAALLAFNQTPEVYMKPVFKLIVAGGREFSDYALLSAEMHKLAENELVSDDVEIVSGMARGADALGVRFANEFNVPLHKYPANWDMYGTRAGFMRNEQMGRAADGLLAFWDGKSAGTKGMIAFMQSLGKSVRVIQYGAPAIAPEPMKLDKPIQWARKGGYECSSKGDSRFSALFARMPDGRTIEQHYQCDVKGYEPGGLNWKLGKGKPPLDKSKDMWKEYLALWNEWAKHNPEMMQQLAVKAAEFDYTLTDMFATTPVNQARALAEVLNNL